MSVILATQEAEIRRIGKVQRQEDHGLKPAWKIVYETLS
jgi:hypothetical protein